MILVEEKNKIAYVILLLASLLIAVIGGTYAFFTAGMSTGETEATLKVGAGQLKIKFANTNSVQIAENVQPTPAKNECTKKTGAYYCDQSQYTPVGTKTFTLTGTNTTDASKNMKMPYNIKLIIPQNQFSSGALKYTLIGSKEANDNGEVVNIDTWKDIPTGANTTGTILGSGYFMPGENVVHTYILNLYFPDNHISQDADKNKIFGAKIEITTDEIKDSMPKGWSSASSGTLLAALRNNNTLSEPQTTPGAEISADDEAVLASIEDDYGTSYYFRGAVTNNYVQFANKCWRIVRVGGDGSVKLILHNDNTAGAANPCNSANNSTSAAFARYSGTTYTSKFNPNYIDNAYVGFMYGNVGCSDGVSTSQSSCTSAGGTWTASTSYANAHANINKSTILTNLETWYNNNLKTYESVIDNSVWCNDKSNVTDTTYNPWNMSNVNGYGYAKNLTYYGAMQRLVSTSGSAGGTGPSLKCNGELSKITSKIGLITADELAFAGYAVGLNNTTTYLQENASNDWWWSLSPGVFGGDGAIVWHVYGSGGIGFFSDDRVSDSYAVRPSISLKSTTNVTGNGTSDTPYKIVS